MQRQRETHLSAARKSSRGEASVSESSAVDSRLKRYLGRGSAAMETQKPHLAKLLNA